MTYLLKNIRVITCNGDDIFENGEVLFSEEGITEAGISVKKPEGAVTEIDGTGKTVIPGLIDSHVHLGMDASPDPFAKMKDDGSEEIAFKAVKQGYEFLAAGITTVRNLGTRYNADIKYSRAVKEGLIEGPRVFAAGRPIVMTGGHGHVMAVEADGPDEVRKAARQQFKAGADLLKVMATAGVLTESNEGPGGVQLNEEELRCACEEAANLSKTVAAHTIGTEGIKNAVRAGVTTIEHAYLLDEEGVQLMVQMGTYLVPTLLAPRLILDKQGIVPDYMLNKLNQIVDDHINSFRLALEAGVPIAAGTDAGTPFNVPGLLADELALMVDCGMSPAEALRSATITAARAVKADSKIGTVEAGKTADLVVVDGDPLTDISILKNPVHVFKDGRLYQGTALNKVPEVQ
ncbi:metal-dependent hydrolase family protein [Evansella clarkii]|uniref:metal-dependent hydrolase family protein n=1 Tax=Evansella clarkii TaxID=79879 RepID=UPI00099623B5|nr:amidohydrolase family protein [Evansella clarkii]